VGLADAEAEVRLVVDNPLPVALPVAGVRWAVEVDGHPVLAGDHPPGSALAARGSTEVPIPIVVRYADVLAAGEGDGGPVDVRVTADLSLDTPAGPVTLPLSWEATLPEVDPPSIGLVGVGVGLDRGDLVLDLELDVDLPLALEVRELGWRATADGTRLGSGEARVGELGRLTLPVRVDPLATAEAAVSALLARTSTLGLVLEGRLDSPVGELPLRLEKELALR
jgi:hypothetical protein